MIDGHHFSLTALNCQIVAAGLTKASIVQAAFDLLDEAGMDGLTVRTLAARLGVKAPALYWHVPGKQALLDEMATQVWRRVGDTMTAVPDDLPWRDLMATYAATMRRELLAHRDGAKAFSGTTLSDPDVVRRQEVTFARLVRQGFTLQNAAQGLLLLHYFTIGACVEEQATAQAIDSGDDRYQPGRRAEMIGPDAPLAAEAGEVIFGDPDTRFAELTSLLLETIARLRPLRPRQPRRHCCSRSARKLLRDEDGPAALLVLSPYLADG